MTELGEYVKSHTVDTGLSMREVAKRAGVAQETVRQLLQGSRRPSDETLQAVADTFPALNLGKMRELAGRPAKLPVRREVPSELDRLTDEEWSVVLRVGRQILKSRGVLDQVAEKAESNGDGDVTRLQAP